MIVVACPRCDLLSHFFTVQGQSRRDVEVQYSSSDCDCELTEAEKEHVDERALEAVLSGEQRA